VEATYRVAMMPTDLCGYLADSDGLIGGKR
jgi:hypothetical protein